MLTEKVTWAWQTLTSRLFQEYQSGSSCRRLDRGKDQSGPLILRFLPTDQSSVIDMEISDSHLQSTTVNAKFYKWWRVRNLPGTQPSIQQHDLVPLQSSHTEEKNKWQLNFKLCQKRSNRKSSRGFPHQVKTHLSNPSVQLLIRMSFYLHQWFSGVLDKVPCSFS